jgi:hypothetical protein
MPWMGSCQRPPHEASHTVTVMARTRAVCQHGKIRGHHYLCSFEWAEWPGGGGQLEVLGRLSKQMWFLTQKTRRATADPLRAVLCPFMMNSLKRLLCCFVASADMMLWSGKWGTARTKLLCPSAGWVSQTHLGREKAPENQKSPAGCPPGMRGAWSQNGPNFITNGLDVPHRSCVSFPARGVSCCSGKHFTKPRKDNTLPCTNVRSTDLTNKYTGWTIKFKFKKQSLNVCPSHTVFSGIFILRTYSTDNIVKCLAEG